jgi:hypothetical protein
VFCGNLLQSRILYLCRLVFSFEYAITNAQRLLICDSKFRGNGFVGPFSRREHEGNANESAESNDHQYRNMLSPRHVVGRFFGNGAPIKGVATVKLVSYNRRREIQACEEGD